MVVVDAQYKKMGHVTLYFYIFLFCISSILGIPPQENSMHKDTKQLETPNEVERNQPPPEINIKTEKKDDHNIQAVKTDDKDLNEEKIDHKKNENDSPKNNITTPKILVNNANIKTSADGEIESGAVMRGIFVFVGITMIFIMYIGFKTYFRRGNKKSPLIKKYGVKTRRSDIEMEPLPLEEDEEDETLFDLGNVTNR